DGETPPEWQGDKWEALGPVKQAGVLCKDEAFQKFLTEKVVPCDSADSAAEIVRGLCNITSRAEMVKNSQASDKWRRIVEEYRAWQREPEIIDSAPIPEPKSAAPTLPTGDGAAGYISRWDNIMLGATNADQLKAKWNEEADERKGIAWAEGQFIALQRKVKRAIDSMKAPAVAEGDRG